VKLSPLNMYSWLVCMAGLHGASRLVQRTWLACQAKLAGPPGVAASCSSSLLSSHMCICTVRPVVHETVLLSKHIMCAMAC
jgi:hypothetical protein